MRLPPLPKTSEAGSRPPPRRRCCAARCGIGLRWGAGPPRPSQTNLARRRSSAIIVWAWSCGWQTSKSTWSVRPTTHLCTSLTTTSAIAAAHGTCSTTTRSPRSSCRISCRASPPRSARPSAGCSSAPGAPAARCTRIRLEPLRGMRWSQAPSCGCCSPHAHRWIGCAPLRTGMWPRTQPLAGSCCGGGSCESAPGSGPPNIGPLSWSSVPAR
mmetsp:Transcript_83690/g.270592  ORF Transcript_83690/g.270592 Transcript_83690/m.270592 type:complete len:213 (-) Transcript_83690:315-953(-)